jgi:hypothetical protein
MFAEPGQRQREAVVKGMARFKETSVTDDGHWQILGRGSNKWETATDACYEAEVGFHGERLVIDPKSKFLSVLGWQ